MKGVLRSAKNFTKGYSDVQIQLREATSNDEWGPTMTQLDYLSRCTFNPVQLADIIYIIDKRLNDHGKYWRHVYKTLLVLEYCVVMGAEDVVAFGRERLHEIRTLREFIYVDDHGNDHGISVREKSKDIVALLMDEVMLQRARETKMLPSQRRPSSIGPMTLDSQTNAERVPRSQSNQEFSPAFRPKESTSRHSFEDFQDVDEDAALAMAIAASKADADGRRNEDLLLSRHEPEQRRREDPKGLNADQLLSLDNEEFERAIDLSYKSGRSKSSDIFTDFSRDAAVKPASAPMANEYYAVSYPQFPSTSAMDPFSEYNAGSQFNNNMTPPLNMNTLTVDPFSDSFSVGSAPPVVPAAARRQSPSVAAPKAIHPIAIPHAQIPALSIGAKPVMPGSMAPHFGNTQKYDASKDVANQGMFIKVMPAAESNEHKTFENASKDPFADLL